MGCSALKRYTVLQRERGNEWRDVPVHLFIDGPREVLMKTTEKRVGHFMKVFQSYRLPKPMASEKCTVCVEDGSCWCDYR